MKKTYERPEVVEIKLEANQAIAACSAKLVGYQNSWKHSRTYYNTYEEAQAAHTGGTVCPVYHVEETIEHQYYTENNSVNWEDWDNNGSFTSGIDGVNNQHGNLPSMLSNGSAAVMNS